MKGVLIFDERANLAFYSVDKEMEEYVYDRMQELEEEAGAKVSNKIPLTLACPSIMHKVLVLNVRYDSLLVVSILSQ